MTLVDIKKGTRLISNYFWRFAPNLRQQVQQASLRGSDVQPLYFNPTGPGGQSAGASFNNFLSSINMPMRSSAVTCRSGEVPCQNSIQCILKEDWCNSVVNCIDSSDELGCTCKDRIGKAKLCDGYADCPDGSDEIGCFGCDQSMLSCYHNLGEYRSSGGDAVCYSVIQKCDGTDHCGNGKDEEDCSIIVSSPGQPTVSSE